MDKTKQDYIAVPTNEPPVYEEEVEMQQPKRGHRFKFFLIGGAIALIGLGHLCNHKYNEFKENSLEANFFEYPKEVANVETTQDLNEFMHHLDRSFGPHPCGTHFNGGPHGPHGPHGHSPQEPHGPHGHPPPSPPPIPKETGLPGHEFAGEKTLDSHHKFHGFANPENKQQNEENFDGERKLDSHHRHYGFPKHQNKENKVPQIFDMPPPPHGPHGHPPHGPHGHFPPPPPPPGMHLLVDEDKKSNPPFPHPENICKVESLNATSTVFNFSPEQFQATSVFLDGFFSRGSKVLLSKSTDKSIQDVRVNVTLFHGNENLTKQVVLSAFDHKGKYQVEVKRDHHGRHFRSGHHNETIQDCLVYTIHVEFPATMDYFDAVGLRIKGARSIEGNLDGIEFGSVKAGLGHGVIHFENLKAKKMKLGVLNGVVVGNYHVGQSISTGSIHGGIKLNVFPTTENINVTTSAISGPSTLNIPSESYSGKFFVSSFSGDSTIQAPEPENVHVTKMRPVFKSGYYKEDRDESNIFVSSKRASATLKFN